MKLLKDFVNKQNSKAVLCKYDNKYPGQVNSLVLEDRMALPIRKIENKWKACRWHCSVRNMSRGNVTVYE